MGNGHDLNPTYFSLSKRIGQMAGRILPAQSSSVKKSIVAYRASSPATRACAKGSRSDRVKAAIRTLERVYRALAEASHSTSERRTLGPKFFAIRPRQIVVFVRIPGCSSLAVRAKNFSSSPLTILSLSLLMIVRTAFKVCSRTTGATSVKPEV